VRGKVVILQFCYALHETITATRSETDLETRGTKFKRSIRERSTSRQVALRGHALPPRKSASGTIC
jgi:hypothetical protein